MLSCHSWISKCHDRHINNAKFLIYCGNVEEFSKSLQIETFEMIVLAVRVFIFVAVFDCTYTVNTEAVLNYFTMHMHFICA